MPSYQKALAVRSIAFLAVVHGFSLCALCHTSTPDPTLVALRTSTTTPPPFTTSKKPHKAGAIVGGVLGGAAGVAAIGGAVAGIVASTRKDSTEKTGAASAKPKEAHAAVVKPQVKVTASPTAEDNSSSSADVSFSGSLASLASLPSGASGSSDSGSGIAWLWVLGFLLLLLCIAAMIGALCMKKPKKKGSRKPNKAVPVASAATATTAAPTTQDALPMMMGPAPVVETVTVPAPGVMTLPAETVSPPMYTYAASPYIQSPYVQPAVTYTAPNPVVSTYATGVAMGGMYNVGVGAPSVI